TAITGDGSEYSGNRRRPTSNYPCPHRRTPHAGSTAHASCPAAAASQASADPSDKLGAPNASIASRIQLALRDPPVPDDEFCEVRQLGDGDGVHHILGCVTQSPKRLVRCKVCKEPLASMDGEDILKYFLTARPRAVRP